MTAEEMGARRWHGISKEQRTDIMRKVASNPRPNAKGKPKPRRRPKRIVLRGTRDD